MEGPFDPQHPGQDAGASQPEAQDGDLHALLERLLGQGDVRPSAPGAGDDLWPDHLRGRAGGRRRLDHRAGRPRRRGRRRAPDRGRRGRRRAGVDVAPARAWEPVVVDSAVDRPTSTTSTRRFSPASPSELEPIAPVAAEPARRARRRRRPSTRCRRPRTRARRARPSDAGPTEAAAAEPLAPRQRCWLAAYEPAAAFDRAGRRRDGRLEHPCRRPSMLADAVPVESARRDRRPARRVAARRRSRRFIDSRSLDPASGSIDAESRAARRSR